MRNGKAVVHRGKRANAGFTYIAVLAAMLVLSLSTQQVMNYVSVQVQREREADLLRTGQAYVEAIAAYYQATPGTVKEWPRKLHDLIEDKRQVTVKRYLREVYVDPITRQADWLLIASVDGGIAGLHSESTAVPMRTGRIDLDGVTLGPAKRYTDWHFVYQPPIGVTIAREKEK